MWFVFVGTLVCFITCFDFFVFLNTVLYIRPINAMCLITDRYLCKEAFCFELCTKILIMLLLSQLEFVDNLLNSHGYHILLICIIIVLLIVSLLWYLFLLLYHTSFLFRINLVLLFCCWISGVATFSIRSSSPNLYSICIFPFEIFSSMLAKVFLNDYNLMVYFVPKFEILCLFRQLEHLLPLSCCLRVMYPFP